MYRIHRAVHWASLDAYIRSLGPAGWWRMDQGVTVTGAGISQVDDLSGNARHLLDPGTTRPIYLPYSGTKYLYLPGVAGNYASTPDSVANSITGDIDIRVRVALNDWTPSANMVLASKYVAPGDYGFIFRVINTTGGLQLLWTADGTNAITKNSTASPTVSDGATIWVRVTLDVDNGATQNEVKFYTAADSASEPTSWTQLGSTVTTAGTTSIFDSSSALEFGVRGVGGVEPSAGRIYRAIIKSGIDGTTVVDCNPADASDGATSFASSATGETWTVNSSGALPAQIVGRASALFNGTSHYLKCNAFTLNQPTCVLMVVKQVSWTNADYICDGNAAVSGVILQNAVSPGVRISAGSVVGDNTGPTIGAYGVVSAVFNGASSSVQINAATPVTGNAGAANMGGFTLGARAGGTVSWSNIQVAEVILTASALSAEQRARAIRYLAGAYGIAL